MPMSVKRRKRRLPSATLAEFEKLPRPYGWIWSFALGLIVAGVIVFAATRKGSTQASVGPVAQPISKSVYPSLGQLAEMSDDELRRQDFAMLNLRCAEGLPGSENLDIQKCLAILNQWAQRVRVETERHLYRAHDPKFAKYYRNSEAFLRASMLVQVLQEDCGVHYNMERIRNIDFTKSQDLFIHGMIGRDNGGTCVSMPVLYTAIARRLGYPIYLTTAKAHLFCRWDDGKERFNMEGSGNGFSAFDDDYYMKWPKPISQDEVKAGYYLKSLTPGEELAVFLAARGHCLEDNKCKADALVCYAQALQRRPDSPDYYAFVVANVGFPQMSNFQQVARRQPVQPQTGYPTPYDLFTPVRPPVNGGVGFAQPYNVFKPYTPVTGAPVGFPNSVVDPNFGLPQ